MICFCAERFHWRRIWQNPGELLTPRTCRHGHSRPPLSAARRTLSTSGQARLANLFDPAAPAPPRAALHLAHSSERPRSDPDHAAARHHRRCQGFRAASWRLDRRASRPFAEGSTVSPGHRGAAARCRAQDRASRRRARHGVDRNARQRRADYLRRRRRRAYRAAGPRLPEARGAQRSAKGLAGLRRGVWRQGEAAVDPRSVEPLGFLHLGRLTVVLVAPDPRAALRARLSRRPRGGASGRDESLGRGSGGWSPGNAPMSSAPRPGSTPTATTCIATASRTSAATVPNSRSTSQPSRPAAASGRARGV